MFLINKKQRANGSNEIAGSKTRPCSDGVPGEQPPTVGREKGRRGGSQPLKSATRASVLQESLPHTAVARLHVLQQVRVKKESWTEVIYQDRRRGPISGGNPPQEEEPPSSVNEVRASTVSTTLLTPNPGVRDPGSRQRVKWHPPPPYVRGVVVMTPDASRRVVVVVLRDALPWAAGLCWRQARPTRRAASQSRDCGVT